MPRSCLENFLKKEDRKIKFASIKTDVRFCVLAPFIIRTPDLKLQWIWALYKEGQPLVYPDT